MIALIDMNRMQSAPDGALALFVMFARPFKHFNSMVTFTEFLFFSSVSPLSGSLLEVFLEKTVIINMIMLKHSKALPGSGMLSINSIEKHTYSVCPIMVLLRVFYLPT